jgi:hypothetical protein
MAKRITNDDYRALARAEVRGNDDLEVDEDAKVSASAEGAWVQAWM